MVNASAFVGRRIKLDPWRQSDGRQAILAGYSALFVPAPTLVAQLAKAHSEGRIEDRLLHFGKPKLLIIDELG